MRWVAAIATDYDVLAVRADARWNTLGELVEAWRKKPTSIVVAGGSAVGGQDHMKVLLLAASAGIEPRSVRYVPFDGGGEALTALLGGFVQLVPADASEALALFRAERIRVLAVLAPQKLPPPFEAVPTASEAGYPVEWIVWRGFFAPPDIGEEAYERWVRSLSAIESSSEWEQVRERYGMTPFFVGGESFEAFIDEQVREFRTLNREIGLLP